MRQGVSLVARMPCVCLTATQGLDNCREGHSDARTHNLVEELRMAIGGILGFQTRTEKARVKEVRDLFEMQFEYTSPHLDEFNKVSQLYEQIVDPATWETSAEITLGQSFALCQNMLPAIMYYTLWAPETPFELIPSDSRTSYETSRKVRENIVFTQREHMNLEWNGYYTINNAVKFGIGYMIVEPKPVTLGGFGQSFAAAGSVNERMSTLGVGKTIDVTSCRNIPVGRIFPTPDGEEPDTVSAVSFLDFVDEFTFVKAFQREGHPFEGDEKRARKIVEHARANRMSGWTSTPRQLADYIARHRQGIVSRMNTTGKKNMPVLVPIIKQYRKNHHIWLAVDEDIIYDVEDKFQTLTCPITKATFAPESGQWFTKGIVGRTYDIVSAVETWINSMYDMLGISLHPHKIMNIEMVAEEDVSEDVNAYGLTRVRGKPSDAVQFLQYPELPSQAFAIPDNMKGFVTEIVGGRPNASQSSTPGIVRGGTGAMESMLQVSTGREKAFAKHVENGWYKRVSELTLASQQTLTNDLDSHTRLMTAGPDTPGRDVGEKYFETLSVSADELRQQWHFEFSFREKLKNFLAEQSHRQQTYIALKDDPRINPEELIRYFVGDEYWGNRLMSGVNAEKRLAELTAMFAARGAGGAGGAGAPAPQNAIAAGRGVGIAQ